MKSCLGGASDHKELTVDSSDPYQCLYTCVSTTSGVNLVGFIENVGARHLVLFLAHG